VRTWRNRAAGGFTMTELLVVMSIIVILVAAAIPTFARLGVFSRGDMQNTARELYNLLTAARVYASTYRVDTAVVYDWDINELNEYGGSSPQQITDAAIGNPVTELHDSLICLRAALMMYRLPGRDTYVPGPGGVEFNSFPGRCVLQLRDPTPESGHNPLAVTLSDGRGWTLKTYEETIQDLANLGLSTVQPDRAYIRDLLSLDETHPWTDEELLERWRFTDKRFWRPGFIEWPAHVFRAGNGALDDESDKSGRRQRYRILLTASPDAGPNYTLLCTEAYVPGTNVFTAAVVEKTTPQGRIYIEPYVPGSSVDAQSMRTNLNADVIEVFVSSGRIKITGVTGPDTCLTYEQL